MDKHKLVRFVVLSSAVLIGVTLVVGLTLSSAFAAEPAPETELAAPAPFNPATGWVAMAIAVSVGSGALGAGYAVAKVGSAAIGAASERPEMMGRALVFVVIAEGIAVWGLVGAILLIGKL
jgi:V/A-type H+-transporting ATPase subunit K